MEELPWSVGKDRAGRRARGRCGGRGAGGGEAARGRALLGRRRARHLLSRLPPGKRARLLLRLPSLRAPRGEAPHRRTLEYRGTEGAGYRSGYRPWAGRGGRWDLVGSWLLPDRGHERPCGVVRIAGQRRGGRIRRGGRLERDRLSDHRGAARDVGGPRDLRGAL